MNKIPNYSRSNSCRESWKKPWIKILKTRVYSWLKNVNLQV